MMKLVPPPGWVPFRKFCLASGNIYQPNVGDGGSVTVNHAGDEAELRREGWVRQTLIDRYNSRSA